MVRWRRRLGLAGAALAVVVGGAQAPAGAQMLASIPVLADGPQAAPAAGDPPGLRVRVQAADVQGLARLLGVAADPDPSGRPLELTLLPGRHPELVSPVDALAASFIVDFDAPDVVRLGERLVAEHGSTTVGGAQVVAFVARSVRSLRATQADLASQVARTLEGDCTEHALLTAALARAQGIPARIVHGAALVHADGRWQAYGHAWVQTHEAGRWALRDSALAGWNGPVYYLPAFVVADEGPGYRLGMLTAFGRMPSRIEVLGPATR